MSSTHNVDIDYRTRRGGWAKHVSDVDHSQHGGYALIGEFVQPGSHDLTTGAVVVVYEGGGRNMTEMYQVDRDGGLKAVDKWGGKPGREVIEAVAEALGRQQRDEQTSPLAQYTDDDLLIEIRARGYRI